MYGLGNMVSGTSDNKILVAEMKMKRLKPRRVQVVLNVNPPGSSSGPFKMFKTLRTSEWDVHVLKIIETAKRGSREVSDEN